MANCEDTSSCRYQLVGPDRSRKGLIDGTNSATIGNITLYDHLLSYNGKGVLVSNKMLNSTNILECNQGTFKL